MNTAIVMGLIFIGGFVVGAIFAAFVFMNSEETEKKKKWDRTCVEMRDRGFHKFCLYTTFSIDREDILTMLSNNGVDESMIYEDDRKIEYLTKSNQPLVVKKYI